MSDDDLDNLIAAPPMPGSKECHVCWAIRQMTGPTADKLAEAASRRDVPWRKVSDAIHARLPQITPGNDSIRRHRAHA